MECLLLNVDKENKLYLNKLKSEIKSIQLLSDIILGEVKLDVNKEISKLKTEIPFKSYHYSGEKSIEAAEELYSNMSNFLLFLNGYLNQRGNFEDHFSTLPAIVKSPKILSLAALCSLLWKRIESLSFSKPKATDASDGSGFPEFSNKEIQTENSCLSYCASCCDCTDLVKLIVSHILTEQNRHGVKKTNVSEFRKNVNKNLFDMSQLGAMRGWTNAILKDIQWASKTMWHVFRELEEMQNKQKAFHKEHGKRISKLENNLNFSNAQLEAEQAQCAYLKHQIDDLNHSLTRRIKQELVLSKVIEKYKDKLAFLKDTMKFLLDDCTYLKKVHKSLRTLMKATLSSNSRNISNIKNDLNLLTVNVQDNFETVLQKQEDTIINIKNMLQEKEDEIYKLNRNISQIYEENKQCKEKIDLLVHEKNQHLSEIENLKKVVTDLSVQVDESKAREQLLKSHITSSTEPEIKFSGNPQTDMENQRQLNKQKIKVLLRENAKLKNTIQKLEKMRKSSNEELKFNT